MRSLVPPKFLRAFVLSLLGGLCVAAATPPNILLIVSEDNGPELGCYGDPYARTPHLDRLAAEGVRFENAFVPYSVCSPSRACFLTGLYPQQNGQIGLATHHFALYRPDTPNVVTLLKGRDYRAGLIGKLHINPASAFPFDSHAIPSSNFQRKESPADYAAAAARFIGEAGDEPWFLSVNLPDAHLPFIKQAHGQPVRPLTADEVKPLPWTGVDTPRVREQVADYYNCLERLDHGAGLLLDVLEKSGQAANTLVCYIGDHGAQFPRGKGSVYEGALRVPLIVRWPGMTKAGAVRQELVSTLDLLPTWLAAAGMPVPDSLAGKPLQPLLGAEDDVPWRQHVFGFTTGAFPGNCFVQHSVRDARFKLIASARPETSNLIARSYLDESHPNFVISGAKAADQAGLSAQTRQAWDRWLLPPPYELYDLADDPHEWRNLADDPRHAAVKARLIAALTAHQRAIHDPFLDPANVAAFVNDQLARRGTAYQKNKQLRWPYLATFPAWRANPVMPERGLCAHRGAMSTHPENTLPAFEEAVRLGAQMIEFDIQLTKDGALVLMHDTTVDRTTNGKGKVADLTLAELKALDAGVKMAPRFAGTRIPTFEEALAFFPKHIWLNCHLKGGADVGAATAKVIEKTGRKHQAFLAATAAAAEAARAAVPDILICNMERQGGSMAYAEDTIAMQAQFIQLLGKGEIPVAAIKLLAAAGVRVNYYHDESPDGLRRQWNAGVNFPLVNDLVPAIQVAREFGITFP